MALGPAALLELVMHPKIQDAVGRVFENVYGRIFKETTDLKLVGSTKVRPPSDRQLLEQILSVQPTNEEMALAFSSLQADLRRGQNRMLIAVTAIGLVNFVVLVYLASK